MFAFNMNENNTIFTNVRYNDFEIDLLLGMYGIVSQPMLNTNKPIKNDNQLSFDFNKGD